LTSSLTNDIIRTSINYRCVPGKGEPAFVGLADLHDRRTNGTDSGFLLITRRSVVRIHSPLLFPRRPQMGVFGFNMRYFLDLFI